MFKKSQLAMEFVILLSVAFIIFVVYAAVSSVRINNLISDQELVLLEELSTSVEDELILSTRVRDGYSRDLELPDMLDETKNYSIEKKSNTFVFSSENHEVSFLIPPTISGELTKGMNIITKEGGVVNISS